MHRGALLLRDRLFLLLFQIELRATSAQTGFTSIVKIVVKNKWMRNRKDYRISLKYLDLKVKNAFIVNLIEILRELQPLWLMGIKFVLRMLLCCASFCVFWSICLIYKVMRIKKSNTSSPKNESFFQYSGKYAILSQITK